MKGCFPESSGMSGMGNLRRRNDRESGRSGHYLMVCLLTALPVAGSAKWSCLPAAWRELNGRAVANLSLQEPPLFRAARVSH